MDVTFRCTRDGQHFAVDEGGSGQIIQHSECNHPSAVLLQSVRVPPTSQSEVETPTVGTIVHNDVNARRRVPCECRSSVNVTECDSFKKGTQVDSLFAPSILRRLLAREGRQYDADPSRKAVSANSVRLGETVRQIIDISLTLKARLGCFQNHGRKQV